jgi:UDP-N-acetyl-D-mannosaminuronate dehydrogenase
LTAVPESTLYDVAVIGAGYVGLPLAATFAEAGGRVLVIDVQPRIVQAVNAGTSHIEDVTSERLAVTSWSKARSLRAPTTSR